MKPFDVRLRLGITFCLLLALLGLVGWQGMHHLRRLDRELREVIYDRWSEEQIAREAFRLSNLNNRFTLLVFLLDDQQEIERLLLQRAANTQRISELIGLLEPRLDTAEERRLLAAVQAARAPYVQSYQRALAKLIDEHQRDAARQLLVEGTLPRLVVYHDAWRAFAQCQSDQIEHAIQGSRASFAAAERDLLVLIVLAVLLTVGLTWYATRRVTREVAERQRAEEALRQSHGELEQRVQQRTAELAQANQTLQVEIAERRRADEQLRIQATALAAAANAIVITDGDGTIRWVNPAFTKLTGYTAEEAVGQNPRVLKSGRHEEAFYHTLWQTIVAGQVWSGELTNRRKDGSLYDEEMTITPLRNADGTIERYIAIKQDISRRKQVEEALRKKERLLSESQRLGHIGSWFYDLTGPFAWSEEMYRLYGVSPDTFTPTVESLISLIHPDDRPAMQAWLATCAAGTKHELVFRITRPDGAIRFILGRGEAVRDAGSRLLHMAGTAQDITERKRLEAQLIQSQRLETVGKLAGGIAHEFNSIMTAIIGQSELMLSDLASGNPLHRNALAIRQAADRAATLTRQLLAFGRKQLLRPEHLDLNKVLAGLDGMLRQLMGGDVNVRVLPGIGLPPVKADAGQIEQVIINLAINARDAMPQGGKLTLETANALFDEQHVGHDPELKAGPYVMLAITDTGTGMRPEVKARVFEPFFTTKGVGQGTGLGLATCYGIVKQSGGHLSVYSELGRGTTFRMYLPQAAKPADPRPQLPQSASWPRGTETILLVEDDPSLREMASMLLERLGYTVLAGANGDQALSLVQQRGSDPLDLLFTDVVMPRLSGTELAERILASHPHTRVLYTSAYTENAILHQGVLQPGVALLQKPFTPSALALKVREVLDGGKRGAPAAVGLQAAPPAGEESA